jgi:hypothetical protein
LLEGRVEVNFRWQAFELVEAAVLEGNIRTGEELTDGLRDEDFAGRGLGRHPGRGMHGDAAVLLIGDLGLAGVGAGTRLEPSSRAAWPARRRSGLLEEGRNRPGQCGHRHGSSRPYDRDLIE